MIFNFKNTFPFFLLSEPATSPLKFSDTGNGGFARIDGPRGVPKIRWPVLHNVSFTGFISLGPHWSPKEPS